MTVIGKITFFVLYFAIDAYILPNLRRFLSDMKTTATAYAPDFVAHFIGCMHSLYAEHYVYIQDLSLPITILVFLVFSGVINNIQTTSGMRQDWD